jgi:hypothetical protein
MEVRSVGGGCATAVNWLANLIVAATFLHLTQRAFHVHRTGFTTDIAVQSSRRRAPSGSTC